MSPMKYNKMFGWRGWAGGEPPTPLMTVDVEDMGCPTGGDAYPGHIHYKTGYRTPRLGSANKNKNGPKGMGGMQ